jgi:hypothetical protein
MDTNNITGTTPVPPPSQTEFNYGDALREPIRIMLEKLGGLERRYVRDEANTIRTELRHLEKEAARRSPSETLRRKQRTLKSRSEQVCFI